MGTRLLACAGLFGMASAQATQWKCMPDKNWVDGMQYSQEVLGRKSHADAVAHCKAKCGKDGCTGFFYQEHTSNGHQICGFYSKPVNLKNAGWHGHKDGSQLCLKVTGPPPRPMPLEGHTCDTVWTDCHGCYSTGGYCGTPSGALGEKGGHTAVAVCHGTSTWHDRCQTHPSPSPNPSPSAGPTPSPSPSSNPGPPPPSPLPPNPGPPPPLNQSPSPSPSPSMSPSPSPSPPESPSKCLSRVTYINYESVAAIDLVHFFYHGGTMNVYDTDKSGFAPHDYARHTRTEVPCSLFISAVRWVDFKHHGWMGRELDYVLSDADGRVKDVLEQHAGYAPLCASDTWAQKSMGGCLGATEFKAPAGTAIVGLKWNTAGYLTGVETEPLPKRTSDASKPAPPSPCAKACPALSCLDPGEGCWYKQQKPDECGCIKRCGERVCAERETLPIKTKTYTAAEKTRMTANVASALAGDMSDAVEKVRVDGKLELTGIALTDITAGSAARAQFDIDFSAKWRTATGLPCTITAITATSRRMLATTARRQLADGVRVIFFSEVPKSVAAEAASLVASAKSQATTLSIRVGGKSVLIDLSKLADPVVTFISNIDCVGVSGTCQLSGICQSSGICHHGCQSTYTHTKGKSGTGKACPFAHNSKHACTGGTCSIVNNGAGGNAGAVSTSTAKDTASDSGDATGMLLGAGGGAVVLLIVVFMLVRRNKHQITKSSRECDYDEEMSAEQWEVRPRSRAPRHSARATAPPAVTPRGTPTVMAEHVRTDSGVIVQKIVQTGSGRMSMGSSEDGPLVHVVMAECV